MSIALVFLEIPQAKSLDDNENLVPNSDFEVDISNWEAVTGNVSRSSEDVHKGNYSMKGISEETEYNRRSLRIRSTLISDLNDSTYFLSIWLNKNYTGSYGEPSEIIISWYNESGTPLSRPVYIDFSPYTGWKQITWQGNKPYDYVNSCKIEISCSNIFHIYIDDVWFAASPYPIPPKPIDNLVYNPDFETGTSGWIAQEGILSISDQHPHNGSYCMKVQSEPINEYVRGRVFSAYIMNLTNQKYYMSVWVNKDSTAYEHTHVEIYWYQWSTHDSTRLVVIPDSSIEKHFEDNVGWYQITWSGEKFNESTVACRIVVTVQTTGSGTFEFFLDDVWFSEKPYTSLSSMQVSPFFSLNPLLIFFPLMMSAIIRRKICKHRFMNTIMHG